MPRSWEKRFADKALPAREALSGVRRGHDIFLGSGAAEPVGLVASLGKIATEWGREAIRTYAYGLGLRPTPTPSAFTTPSSTPMG
jgi:hypothetical protein